MTRRAVAPIGQWKVAHVMRVVRNSRTHGLHEGDAVFVDESGDLLPHVVSVRHDQVTRQMVEVWTPVSTRKRRTSLPNMRKICLPTAFWLVINHACPRTSISRNSYWLLGTLPLIPLVLDVNVMSTRIVMALSCGLVLWASSSNSLVTTLSHGTARSLELR